MAKFPDVAALRTDALDVRAVHRPWDEMHEMDSVRFTEAPTCEGCGVEARFVAGDELRDESGEPWSDNPVSAWRCADPECTEYGVEVPPAPQQPAAIHYGWALPSLGDAAGSVDVAADLIRDHALTIVTLKPGPDEDYELALTGGGMDMSWDICAAYMRLGFLPPVYACDDLPGGEHPKGALGAWLLAGARRALDIRLGRTQRALGKLDSLLWSGPRYRGEYNGEVGAFRVAERNPDFRWLSLGETVTVDEGYPTAGTYSVGMVLDEDRPRALGGTGFKTNEVLRDLNQQELDRALAAAQDGAGLDG